MIQRELLTEGTVILTADKRKRTVKCIDGKYVYFKDGSCYRFAHPDLIEIVAPAEPDTTPKKKSSSKKKKSEDE